MGAFGEANHSKHSHESPTKIGQNYAKVKSRVRSLQKKSYEQYQENRKYGQVDKNKSVALAIWAIQWHSGALSDTLTHCAAALKLGGDMVILVQSANACL
jgi:hypothetical protein